MTDFSYSDFTGIFNPVTDDAGHPASGDRKADNSGDLYGKRTQAEVIPKS